MFDIAEDLFAVALEILKKTLGIGHPDTANALGNLAVVLIRKENYDRAEKLLSLVLDIRKDSFGEHSYLVAGSMVSLAFIYDRQDKYEKAISLYKSAVAIVFWKRHPTLNHLRSYHFTRIYRKFIVLAKSMIDPSIFFEKH
jgi:tetratricopeptide (TPR) repeat protein